MFVDVSDDVSVNLNSVISVEVAEQMIGTGVFTLIFTTNVGFRYATGKYTKQQARNVKKALVDAYNAIFLPQQDFIVEDDMGLFYNSFNNKTEGNC